MILAEWIRRPQKFGIAGIVGCGIGVAKTAMSYAMVDVPCRIDLNNHVLFFVRPGSTVVSTRISLGRSTARAGAWDLPVQ